MTATRFPVLRSAGCGAHWLPFWASARSAIEYSIVLMVTGMSSMLSVHEASHGAGQTRPVTSGKLFVEWRLRAAMSH